MREAPRPVRALREFLSAAQRIDIVEPHLDVVGFETGRAFEQEFRVVENAELDPDLCEQPHPFDIAWMDAKEMAADFFRTQQPPLMQVMRHRHQLARQCGNPVGLRTRRLCLGHAAHRLLEIGQCPPAGLERGIEPRRTLEGGSGRGIVTLGARQMTRFLPRAPVFGHGGMQRSEKTSGVLMTAEIARSDRGHIQSLAIGGIPFE